jgi:hypothetical protein
MPLRVFSSDGDASVSRVLEAIDYAVDMKAKVINLSLGGAYTDAWDASIYRAHAAGAVIVTAAGNDNVSITDSQTTWFSPVCNDGPNPTGGDDYVIGVANTDRYDRRHDLSNSDSSSAHFVDVSAPGTGIYGDALYVPSFPGFTTYFYTNTGTSFSAPIVSGIAALILTKHPAYTPDQVTALIRASTDNIDGANPGYAGKLGTGRVNVAKALGVALPPSAVTSLKAADTVGDGGGSITLTWVKSSDDGAGLDSVTEYVILRRIGTTGTWNEIKRVSKGIQTYADSPTVDGTQYYYAVRASDGTRYTDSPSVGPVQSRNDAPPVRVANLKAADHPGDSGGAVDLAWSAVIPADFKETRIYRKSSNFSSLTGLAPLAVLTYSGAKGGSSAVPFSYTDSSATDGVDYYYAVAGVDTAGNLDTTVVTTGPVQSYPNTSVPLAAGLRMFASPVVPADTHLTTLLGLSAADVSAARWNAATSAYDYFTSSTGLGGLGVTLGRSLWLSLVKGASVSPSGASAPSGDFAVALTPGWQALGNPFFGTFDFGACTVTYGGATMDLATAHTRGILAAYAWVYDQSAGEYRLLTSDASGGRLVPPWQGFWVLCWKACTLNILRPTGALSIPAQATTANTGWSVQLRATAARGGDTQNWFGVRPSAGLLRIAAPPAIGDRVQLDFVDGTASGSGPLAADFRVHLADGMKWQVVVHWGSSPGEVRVSWPDLSSVPPEYAVTVRDLTSGKAVSARHEASYSFTASADGGSRLLEVELVKRTGAPVVLTGLTSHAAATGAELVFQLSQTASCDVSVTNIAGRPVRALEAGKVRVAGSNVVLWDGRSASGTLVPAGLYLVRVTASTESGATANGLSTLRIVR